METRLAHWKQKWKMLQTGWTVTGYSRAAYRTGFYIPELGIMLDAGPQNFNNPKHIFITHTHGDHIANLPFTMIVDEEAENFTLIQLYGPQKAEKHIKEYITTLFTTNAMTYSLWTKMENLYKYNGFYDAGVVRINIKNTDYDLQIFLCDHAIPTISYGFSSISNKLKPEYHGRKGIEIKALRESGVEITKEVPTKRFAYICDTSIKVLETNPDILEYSLVFIECTFIYKDELENANKTKHIHWEYLRPYVTANPQTHFVLIHFSLRYTEEEILKFFAKQMALHGIKNIKVWAGDTTQELEPDLDGAIEEYASNFVDQLLENVIETLKKEEELKEELLPELPQELKQELVPEPALKVN